MDDSHRFDNGRGNSGYAYAGIPPYWVIDLEPSVSLTAFQLVGGFGYQEAGQFTGTFETDTPFSLRLSLEELRHD